MYKLEKLEWEDARIRESIKRGRSEETGQARGGEALLLLS